MELIRGAHNLRPSHRGCVATIGNYDGVHLGHRAVLEQLRHLARPLGLPITVITFEPTPQEYFAAEGAPARLSRLPEKLAELAAAGVDRALCLRFDASLARMPAQAFIERFLIAGLGVRELVVGDDFRFGRGREGDFELLTRVGREAGFGVHGTHTLSVDGERVSSSRIRNLLAAGDLQQARRLLGRPYALCGRVMHGDKLVGLSMFNGYSYNERCMLSLGVVDADIKEGDVLTLIWGEPDGGTDKTSTEKHTQAEIRVRVSPTPYASEARENYAESWRTKQHG